jgi:hypothetical protein
MHSPNLGVWRNFFLQGGDNFVVGGLKKTYKTSSLDANSTLHIHVCTVQYIYL